MQELAAAFKAEDGERKGSIGQDALFRVLAGFDLESRDCQAILGWAV
jgi:hypothetical protein